MGHSSSLRPIGSLVKGSVTTAVLPSGRALAIALQRHRVSERAAADAMGLGPTEVHRMVCGEHRVDLDRLAQGLPAVAATLGELYADSCSLPHAVVATATRHLTATALLGRCAEEIRAGMADGSITQEEGRRVAQAALAAAEELRRLAADVLREAV